MNKIKDSDIFVRTFKYMSILISILKIVKLRTKNLYCNNFSLDYTFVHWLSSILLLKLFHEYLSYSKTVHINEKKMNDSKDFIA